MRTHTILALLVALSTAGPGHGGPVAVPEAAIQDIVALESAIPGLAAEALASMPAGSRERAELQIRVHLATGRYAEALAELGDWQRLRPLPSRSESVEPWLRQELHARAKVLETSEHISYETAFARVLDAKFATLDDRSAADSAWALGLPPGAARWNVERELGQLRGRRELAASDLMNVLWWSTVHDATSHYAPTLAAAIAIDDARRFAIERGVLIRTRDGATVAADVVRLKRATDPLPAILHFTIYARPEMNFRDAKDAAVRGYAGVFANSRGKYASTSRIVPWETEVGDTHDVIDWISRQSWSNGKVGMFGHSYAGFSQWAAAKRPHPALKTIVPSGASFPGNGLPMQNNVFSLAQYAWTLQVTNDRFMGDPALHDWTRWSSLFQKWFESGRPFREIDAIDGTPNELFQKQLRHPDFDTYWQAMQPHGREFAALNIPVLSLTGYFDDANSAAVNYLVDHVRRRRDAEHYLVIGPYAHHGVLTPWKESTVSGYGIDPVAQIDSLSLVYGWFDHVLRGAPKPALLRDRINYQVMGANTWAHAPSIAKMSDRRLRLYLSERIVGNRHVLTPNRPAKDGFVTQSIDLADRRMTSNLYPVSAWLETPDAPTRIAYLSEPFEAPCEVNGLVTGKLQAAIDRRDFDFTWSLYEATPDGRYFKLSHYLGRASYANDPTTRRLLTPGKVESLPFSRTPLVSKRMSKGSRLLLLLTVNKNPFAQVNHGSGKDVSDESLADAADPLEVRWHNGSFIEVPLRDDVAL